MNKNEFEQTLRKLAILVIGFIAWALVVLVLSYVISGSGIADSYRYYTDLLIFFLLVIGVYFVIIRIFALVYAIDDPEEPQT